MNNTKKSATIFFTEESRKTLEAIKYKYGFRNLSDATNKAIEFFASNDKDIKDLKK